MVTPPKHLSQVARARAQHLSPPLTLRETKQAQTLEQRRRNAKFAKDQEAKMGKSEDQLKKRAKETPKSPISVFWLAVLAFVVFGGLVFELLSRFFGV
ncbi:hypothetical protein CCMA1212_002438 [Trichoderma ghanense]|uniref:Stress-associated endoplasmic reticulum protein n=1 Tax=Trichoderma ghanense TaxID=65468 RepID=A0ABY2HAU6_9HYPO